jgi:dienelactone hydrolase
MTRSWLERTSRGAGVTRAALLVAAGAALLAVACARPAHAAAAKPAPPPEEAHADASATKTPDQPSRADKSTDALMKALANRDYKAVYALYDENMKKAVPEGKLQEIWEDQMGQLGSVTSWSFGESTTMNGLDVKLGVIHFAHGDVKSMIAIHPDTGLVAGFYLKPAPPPAPPAAYVDSTKFRAKAVEVGSAPFLLGGTLTMPVGKGRFPAAVLVHGSGPQDRDESIGGNKVFKDIAEGLSSVGIAVLRYDKRTLHYAKEMKQPVTLDDETMLDAVAAVRLLRKEPGVDSTRLYVIGHSLGAQLAPEIAVRAGHVAGVVLLAPPGRPPWELLLEQLRYVGSQPEVIAAIEERVALLKEGKLGDRDLLGQDQAYWQDWARRDGIAMARKCGCRVLVLRGERDYQTAAVDFENWKKGLAGMPNVELETLPGLNHLFIAGTGPSTPAEYDTPAHVAAVVIQKIRAFIEGK